MSLNQQQVDAYKTDGYLTGIRVVSEGEAARYRTLFDALEAVEGREKSEVGLVDRHFDQEFIWELATNPKVLDCVEALIGPNILLLATHFFCKYGPEEKFVAWHQDVTFWGLEPPYAITAWYAVDDSDRENGCMRVIPNSHQQGIREHGKAQQQGNLLSVNQELPVSSEEEQRAADLILRAGEISLHDGALIHGSLPNHSTRRRCGLTLRYVPTWVRQTEEMAHSARWKAVLVRGEDREKHFGERAHPFPVPSP